MARDVLWAPWDAPGLEHLRLEIGAEAISADGAIIAIFDGEVFRASYQIICDCRLARARGADTSRRIPPPTLFISAPMAMDTGRTRRENPFLRSTVTQMLTSRRRRLRTHCRSGGSAFSLDSPLRSRSCILTHPRWK